MIVKQVFFSVILYNVLYNKSILNILITVVVTYDHMFFLKCWSMSENHKINVFDLRKFSSLHLLHLQQEGGG